MGLSWLGTGMAGALMAGLLALAIGAVLSALTHLAAPRLHWREGSAIGVALVIALAIGAGTDAWHLLYLSIVRLESPFVIQRTLGGIHDPATLGLRVVLEFIGVVCGVMIGWLLSGRPWRRR